jgi:hypothetical protein
MLSEIQFVMLDEVHQDKRVFSAVIGARNVTRLPASDLACCF